MRAAKERKYYAVPGEDGAPRVCHAVPGSEPDEAVEITEAHAKVISADVRAREPRVERAGKSTGNFVTKEQFEARLSEVAKAAASIVLVEVAKSAEAMNAGGSK